ncbi:MAG: N(4)-(beta-N-acetylglucosaminyl)-L-asparaginase [Bacteroidota bacterium]
MSFFSRRKFIRRAAISSIAGFFSNSLFTSCQTTTEPSSAKFPNTATTPLAIATWTNRTAVDIAHKALGQGRSSLDAVEMGVRHVEADPNDRSVGYGGRPDRAGKVTLDACIMNASGNCGAVCYLQEIKHPISVARKVMEETPHVLLAGDGALQFALSHGFEKENLLTEASKKDWLEWKKEGQYQPIINVEQHDTIGMLAIDDKGDIAGACTTSGLAYKLPGRVGDSPIIGAGLFVDNEIGGAVATGMGEAVLKSLGSFLIVELMRQGKSPTEACKEAIMRIVKKQAYKDIQVGFLAINKAGEYGSYSIQKGFDFVVQQNGPQRIETAVSHIKNARKKD